MLPLKVLGDSVFQAPLPASGTFLAYESLSPILIWGSLCMFLCFCKDTVRTGSGPNLPHDDFILTNYICNELISK